MADNQQQSPGLLANVLAVAGFFILIIIIVWGAYHLLRLTGSGVSSLFSRFSSGSESIAITVPTAPVQSGKAFTLSWKFSPKEDGLYAFLYQCKEGVKLDAKIPSGGAVAIPCGNAFTVGNGTAIELQPSLTGTASIEVPITVLFKPMATSSTNKGEGTATLVVAPGSTQTVTTTKPAQTTTKPADTTPVAHVTGLADISVSVIGVGVIDSSGNFVLRQPVNSSEISAIKFDIGNKGGNATGSYYFTVQLPMSPTYTYTSPIQNSLNAGDHVVNILRFRPLSSGGGTISILADSTFTVPESNEVNNIASQWAGAPTWTNYQYQQPYVY